jgi:hypothetical protein
MYFTNIDCIIATYYVLGPGLEARDRTGNKTDKALPLSSKSIHIPVKERER